MNLWVMVNGSSYQIISANVHEKDGSHQVWVERPTGKSLKIFESSEKEQVKEVKDMIDFAIKNKVPALEL